MKNIKIKSMLIAISIIISTGIAPISASAETTTDARELTEYALSNKSFYNFNMAYAQINSLTDENQKGQLMSRLATISSEVWTPNVTKAVALLGKVCTQKDGRIYADTEAFLKALTESEMDKMTQGYLLGQLTGWGRDFVFTQDYVTAVDTLGKAWVDKDVDSITKTEAVIESIKNQSSKEYLLEQLNYLKDAANEFYIVDIQ